MKTNNCIRNLLKYVSVLQKNSCEVSCDVNNCSSLFLGPSIAYGLYNTRVINLYTRTGQLFESLYFRNNQLETSSYFRIQDVDRASCTLLILENSNGQFLSTGQTIKLRLACIGAVKCIEDININI